MNVVFLLPALMKAGWPKARHVYIGFPVVVRRVEIGL